MIVDRGRVAAALPGYELGDQIGAGAFGLVLAGWHRVLHRDVAIKIFSAQGHDRAAGFEAEARILARLDHPHIIRVHDYVETGNLRLIVMEMMAGGPLTRRQADMTPQQACAVGLSVSAALSHAHTQGVLHRDIKPDNVLFDADGVLKVADFGIAKLLGRVASMNTVVGTPLFMAPEQRTGGRLGPSTDVYALGVMLHLLFADMASHAASSPVDNRGDRGAPVLAQLPVLTDVPVPVLRVIGRAMATARKDRPQTAREFAVDLAHAATAAYGPGWLARSGLPIRIDDDVRAAVEQRPAAHPPANLAMPHQGVSSPEPDGPGAKPDTSLTARDSSSTSGVPDEPAVPDPHGEVTAQSTARHRRASRSRPSPKVSLRKRITAALLAIALLTAAGTVLMAILSPREPSAPTVKLLGRPLSQHTHWVLSVAFSPDSETLASASRDGTVILWDVTDPAHARPVGLPLPGRTTGVVSVAFSNDGRTLASGNWDGTVRLWDVTDRAHPQSLGRPLLGHTNPVNSVVFVADDRALASADREGTRLWDVQDRSDPQPLGHPLPGEADWPRLMVPDEAGTALARAGGDRTIQMWDVADPANPRQLDEFTTGHVGEVYALAFSQDQRTMATGGRDTVLRLWDTTDRTKPTLLGEPLTGHTSSIWSVVFSPGGYTAATASYDLTVRLWDLRDRQNPRPLGKPLTGHTDWVMAVAFSPNGRVLATGSQDHTIRLWDASKLPTTPKP